MGFFHQYLLLNGHHGIVLTTDWLTLWQENSVYRHRYAKARWSTAYQLSPLQAVTNMGSVSTSSSHIIFSLPSGHMSRGFHTNTELHIFPTSVITHNFNPTLSSDDVAPTTDFRTVIILVLLTARNFKVKQWGGLWWQVWSRWDFRFPRQRIYLYDTGIYYITHIILRLCVLLLTIMYISERKFVQNNTW
jgi:hypothetical protein